MATFGVLADLPLFVSIPGLLVLFGAAVLLVTGVGSWRTMLAGVLGMLGAAFFMPIIAEASGLPMTGPMYLSPWEHLLCGGFLFGIP